MVGQGQAREPAAPPRSAVPRSMNRARYWAAPSSARWRTSPLPPVPEDAHHRARSPRRVEGRGMPWQGVRPAAPSASHEVGLGNARENGQRSPRRRAGRGRRHTPSGAHRRRRGRGLTMTSSEPCSADVTALLGEEVPGCGRSRGPGCVPGVGRKRALDPGRGIGIGVLWRPPATPRRPRAYGRKAIVLRTDWSTPATTSGSGRPGQRTRPRWLAAYGVPSSTQQTRSTTAAS